MIFVLTGVDVGVFLHVRLLVEALATVLARVGPRVRVDQKVRRERRRSLERLLALLALETKKALYDYFARQGALSICDPFLLIEKQKVKCNYKNCPARFS